MFSLKSGVAGPASRDSAIALQTRAFGEACSLAATQAMNNGPGYFGDDFAIVRVACGERDEDKLFARWKLDEGGIVPGFTGPPGLGPELGAGRQSGAGESTGLIVGWRVCIKGITAKQRQHFLAAFRGHHLPQRELREQARGGISSEGISAWVCLQSH